MTRKEKLQTIAMLNSTISLVLAENKNFIGKESSDKNAEIFSMIITVILKDYIKDITYEEIEESQSTFEESFKHFSETVYNEPN